VSTATSAKEAFELLENFIFDLIILDVMMPEITGLEFAEKIKAVVGNSHGLFKLCLLGQGLAYSKTTRQLDART
jgi:CheY-like chemotaxis protein